MADYRPQASKSLLPPLSKGGIPLFGKEGLGEILDESVWAIREELILLYFKKLGYK